MQKSRQPDADADADACGNGKGEGGSLSLAKDILLCDPSCVLYRFSRSAGESLTVSQLSNRYVGLYLCIDRSFIHPLKVIHDRCIANKQELEIVIVYLPVAENPKLYFRQLLEFAGHMKSWFVFPYKNTVSRRLWRIFGFHIPEDRFLVLPPNCKSGDLRGRSVIQYYLEEDHQDQSLCRLGRIEL